MGSTGVPPVVAGVPPATPLAERAATEEPRTGLAQPLSTLIPSDPQRPPTPHITPLSRLKIIDTPALTWPTRAQPHPNSPFASIRVHSRFTSHLKKPTALRNGFVWQKSHPWNKPQPHPSRHGLRGNRAALGTVCHADPCIRSPPSLSSLFGCSTASQRDAVKTAELLIPR